VPWTNLKTPAFLLLVAIAALAPACSKSPSEPEAPSGSAATISVPPLAWDVPGSWSISEFPKGGQKKAVYKVPKAGNDKEDAELTVAFFGTGSEGDEPKRFKEAFAQFDGDVGATAQRDALDVKGTKVEIADVAGTYKISLTPPVGPTKRSPVQMVKPTYRMMLAVVKTSDRGNWYFKLVGPDETVQAARSGFRTVLESVR
jgi:hypothetical protein